MGLMIAPSVAEREAYIRQAARALGIDPDTAVKVAKSEGLQEGTWQSNIGKGTSHREQSYGDFQLNTQGGLGTEFQRQTRLNPTDPANWQRMVDFALNRAKTKGWGEFHGAADTGIGNQAGIGKAISGGARPVTPMQWIIEQQTGATRNQPLSEATRRYLEAAGQATGLQARVFSGGQPSEGGRRTGSHRHDLGGAADIHLFDPATNRVLDMTVPADQARMAAYVQAAAKAGATGIGGGTDYMGSTSLHIGGGPRGVWGGGGRSANTPDWLRKAFYGVQGGAPPAAAQYDPLSSVGKPTSPFKTFASWLPGASTAAPAGPPAPAKAGLLGALAGLAASQGGGQQLAPPPPFQGPRMAGGDVSIPQFQYPQAQLPVWGGGQQAPGNPEDQRMKQLLAMLGRG